MDFSTPLNTLEAAKEFISELVRNGLAFHFEEDPADIVIIETDEPMFTADEVPQVTARVDELYTFDWGDGECPIGYMMDLLDAQEVADTN